jgi:hypothetical protein
MDTVFQGIQEVMAKQNGPESTRYCGGCHDPISLFSRTKNIFAENLTGLQGYKEGVSCLGCHRPVYDSVSVKHRHGRDAGSDQRKRSGEMD